MNSIPLVTHLLNQLLSTALWDSNLLASPTVSSTPHARSRAERDADRHASGRPRCWCPKAFCTAFSTLCRLRNFSRCLGAKCSRAMQTAAVSDRSLHRLVHDVTRMAGNASFYQILLRLKESRVSKKSALGHQFFCHHFGDAYFGGKAS